MDKTPFTEEFAAELQRKARALCKTDLIEVSLWASGELTSRRMVNKAPILNNFLSEIQGDVDLTRIYQPGRTLVKVRYELATHWREGMIHVVSYRKDVVTR